ncbi:MAG: hypothetical protein WCC48_14185 [Anaeromyxobacteraceae bacterium]
MPTPRIAYLATGTRAIRCQALFAAHTALAWRGELPLAIHVYTDAPAAFAELAGAVTIEPLDPATERRWRGPWGFLYRMKPKLLEDLSGRHPSDPILLLDADTYWRGAVGRAFERISGGQAVMHEREYFVGTLGTLQMRNFRRRMARASLRGRPIDVEAWMWNSGAVGLHPLHAPLIGDWIDYLDEVHPYNRKPIVEQYAISWLLQRRLGAVVPCDDVLVHYWADKERHLAAILGALARVRTLDPAARHAWLRAEPLMIRGAPPERSRGCFVTRMRESVAERLPLLRREV